MTTRTRASNSNLILIHIDSKMIIILITKEILNYIKNRITSIIVNNRIRNKEIH
jgi:hypothetical protein